MKRICLSFLVSCIFCSGLYLPALAYATQPTISNIVGTLAAGQILTITGANMVNEDTTNWYGVFKNNPNASGFEGSTPVGDGYTYPSGDTWPPVYDASVKLMGNQSLKFHIQGIAATTNPHSSDVYIGGLPAQADLWIRWYSRFNLISGTWPTAFMKELYALNAGLYLDNLGQPLPTQFTVKGASDATHNYGNSYQTATLPNNLIRNNVWYCVEVHWNNTTTNPIYEIYVNGVRIWNSGIQSGGNLSPIMMGIINYNSSDASMSIDHWWDGFAISSTRIYEASKIEVSNNATYGQGTIKSQEPIYLSDGSIQFKANFTGLGTGPLYLWVTNNMQQTSTSYYLGSGLGTTAATPSAPTNVH